MRIIIIYMVTSLIVGVTTGVDENYNGKVNGELQPNLMVLEDLPIFNEELEQLRIERSAKKDIKKNKSRKRERKRKLAVAAVEKVVRETLHQELEPLTVALQMIKVDSFSNGIIRQLTNLEKIQSKVLTEYGELRAAISEIGRHTMDLGRQVASLDERIATLDRQLLHRMGLTMSNNDLKTLRNSESITLSENVATLSIKLLAAERNFKENLINLENRTLDSIKLSKTVLERRMAVSDMEMNKHFLSLENTINKGICMPTLTNLSLRKPTEGRKPFNEYSFRKSFNSFNIPKIGNNGEDLVYITAEEKLMNSDHLERSERQHPPLITPFASWPRPKTDYESAFSHGGASRLASEIAKYLKMEDYSVPARDCSDWAEIGKRENGIYNIYPSSCTKRYTVKVFCNLEDVGGGWTVIQRRGPSLYLKAGSYGELSFSALDFYRDWLSYKWGFGSLNGEYWLGNEYIHQLTHSGDYKLRVELEDWTGEKRWAEYSHFLLSSESQNFSLHIGEYTGNAGNSMRQHQGSGFSTKDRDNDANPRGQCARTFHGAWWFNSCHDSHLNGKYYTGRHKSYGDGINWLTFKGHSYSLKRTTMMIRTIKK